MRKITLLAVVLFALFCDNTNAQTDILNWTGSSFQVISSGNVYMQNFTMPAGNDYYITEIGMNINSSSGDGTVHFGIYEGNEDLVFKTEEVSYTGGTSKYVFTNVPQGVQKLEAGKNYFVAVTYSGANSLFIDCQASPTNTGIATGLGGAQFKTEIPYPSMPDPRTVQGSWGISLSFVIKGEAIASEITPKDEILDFNCTGIQSLTAGNIYSDHITIPAGSNYDVRQLGIKTGASYPNGTAKFAVYNSSYELLLVTDEITPPSVADTIYAAIAPGALSLEGGQQYVISMQYNGSNPWSVLYDYNPDCKGIATVNGGSSFMVDQTYPTFPNPYNPIGSWGTTLGMVINNDEPSGSTDLRKTKINVGSLKLFPTIAKDFIWVYAENKGENPIPVTIYSLSGEIMKEDIIQGKEKIDISELSSGTYIVKGKTKNGSISSKFIKE